MGWLLFCSIFISTGITLAIQETNQALGYYIGTTLLAIHFFAVVLYNTRNGGERNEQKTTRKANR